MAPIFDDDLFIIIIIDKEYIYINEVSGKIQICLAANKQNCHLEIIMNI